MKVLRLILACLLWGQAFFLSGCALYAGRIREPRAAFEAGNYDLAIAKLKEYADKKDNDELLYLMDLGMVYHAAGRYKEAISTFLRADKMAEIKDYTSLAQEAGSVLLNDEIKPYKGEDFEKVMINMYLAIDYTMLGDYENGLVECRKVNRKLDRMITEGKMPYHNNAFAKYLAAALFEARQEYNDAFVDYRQLLKWDVPAAFAYLGTPLLRLSDKLKAEQEFATYKKKFPGVTNYQLSSKEGEVVLLFEAGKAPYKVPSPQFHLVPIFHKNSYATLFGRLSREGAGEKVETSTLFDVEATAIKELDDKSGAIIAKKLAGIAAKEAAAAGVEAASDSKFLGGLTRIFLHVSDTADLRSWNTLPALLQIARFKVPAGTYNFNLDLVTQGGTISGAKRWTKVDVKPKSIVFLNYRSTQ